MAYQLTTEELRRRAEAFLGYRAEETPEAVPDPSADLTLLDCDGPTGSLTLRYDTKPWMANIWGVVHGGVVATLVDTCMGITCGIQCDAITPTVSMTVNYARPVPLDAERTAPRKTICSAGKRPGTPGSNRWKIVGSKKAKKEIFKRACDKLCAVRGRPEPLWPAARPRGL